MSANTSAIRIARTKRMLNEIGHTDIIEALGHAKEMQTALRVIHTWSGFDGALDYMGVRKLTSKALRMKVDK